MGLFGGRSVFGRFETEEEKLFKELEAQSINPSNKTKKLPSLREQARQQIVAKRLKQSQVREQKLAGFRKQFDRGSERVGESVGQFGRAAIPEEPIFTREQEAIRSMFGGGGKVWGYGEPVTINNDLMPSRNGDFSTGRLFGF